MRCFLALLSYLISYIEHDSSLGACLSIPDVCVFWRLLVSLLPLPLLSALELPKKFKRFIIFGISEKATILKRRPHKRGDIDSFFPLKPSSSTWCYCLCRHAASGSVSSARSLSRPLPAPHPGTFYRPRPGETTAAGATPSLPLAVAAQPQPPAPPLLLLAPPTAPTAAAAAAA